MKNTEKYISDKEIGFDTGKLYTFRGNYRLLYIKDGKRIKANKKYKISNGDNVFFIKSELNKFLNTRQKVFYFSDEKNIKHMFKYCFKYKNYKIIDIKPTPHNMYSKVFYKPKIPLYVGKIQVLFKDKVGWINIRMADKQTIKKQFVLYNETKI